MTVKLHVITDESTWLERRKSYITSTESAALFGESSWKTAFQLWHEKRGNIDDEIEDNNFLAFGRLMEEPICKMVSIEKPEWRILPFSVFAEDDEKRMGASFDRFVRLEDETEALLEIKTISYKKYKEKFIEHGDGTIEALPQYEFQAQHQLDTLDRYDTCIIVVFIADTRTLKYVTIKRSDVFGKAIRDAVKEFWDMETPPAIDYARDKSVLAEVLPSADPDKQIDGYEDAAFNELLARYKNEKDLEKQSKKNADEAYAEILDKMQDARYAWTKDYKVSASDIKKKTGTYKRLTVTEVKKGR